MQDSQSRPNPRHVVTEEAFNVYRDQIYTFGKGELEAMRALYDDWAGGYEEQALFMGYVGPEKLAGVAADVLGDRSARILDAASGVGMLGKELKACGFTCIDALDPSQGSLDKSKENEAYTEYICDTLDEHQTKIADNHYDAVIMCGAFGIPGHVTLSCFPELIRITKPGGHIIFTMSTKVASEWNDRLEDRIREENARGTLELIEYRWILYHIHKDLYERAKVPILRVL